MNGRSPAKIGLLRSGYPLPAAACHPGVQHLHAVLAPEWLLVHDEERGAEDLLGLGLLDLVAQPVLDRLILQGGLHRLRIVAERRMPPERTARAMNMTMS